MRIGISLTLLGMLWLSSCRVNRPGSAAVLVGNEAVVIAVAAGGTPDSVLRQAGFSLLPGDRLLSRGHTIDPAKSLVPGEDLQLQIIRATEVSLNGKKVRTAATSVGELLEEQEIEIFASDRLNPDPETAIANGLEISHVNARTTTLVVDSREFMLRGTSGRMDSALAEAGSPILGLDATLPPTSSEGVARLARVTESVVLAQDSVPFESLHRESPELELGMEQVLSPGTNGISMTRTRITLQEGVEISRHEEATAIVRFPVDRVVVRGSRVVEKRASVDGVSIRYWRTLQMYATVYSPCSSGTIDGSCSHGTASGLPAGRGVVAVDPDLFGFLNGQRLYIPGYGFAVIGDVGGGYIVEESTGISRYRWIDLGFDDGNIQDMTGWISVYFLTPAPASIPDALK